MIPSLIMLFEIMIMLLVIPSMLDGYMLVFSFILINFRINLIPQMPNSTIQKTYYRRFAGLNMVGFIDALKPDKFTRVHFKRWADYYECILG